MRQEAATAEPNGSGRARPSSGHGDPRGAGARHGAPAAQPDVQLWGTPPVPNCRREFPRARSVPKLMAVIALFTGAYRVSRRVALSALSDMFGVKLALGSVSNAEEAMSAAVAAPVEQAPGSTSSGSRWRT